MINKKIMDLVLAKIGCIAAAFKYRKKMDGLIVIFGPIFWTLGPLIRFHFGLTSHFYYFILFLKLKMFFFFSFVFSLFASNKLNLVLVWNKLQGLVWVL